MSVHVLINDTVKNFLLRSTEDRRREFRKAFEYLENGLWDGGLRVKKLHGVSRKTVLEGRLNRGDRLLFTIGRRHDGHDLLVYIWGIASHDEVSRKARSIFPENAPFLNFSATQQQDIQDVDLSTLDPDCFNQEGIEERSSSESGSQRWFPLNEEEWKRILLYSKDDFEIFLYLTQEQDRLLLKKPPLLISGTAGSGKTTLAVYYLLSPFLKRKSKIFLTYNRALRNFSERLYRGLLNEVYDREEIRSPEFLTFMDICLQLVSGSGKRFTTERFVDFPTFRNLYLKHRIGDKFDPTLVWEEIRSIIKGAKPQISTAAFRDLVGLLDTGMQGPEVIREIREEILALRNLSIAEKAGSIMSRILGCSLSECSTELERLLIRDRESLIRTLHSILNVMDKMEANFESPLMTLKEYEDLGKKRAPLFVHNRSEIYSIAQWYQNLLEQNGWWDEIDLTRAAIRCIDTGRRPEYDFVCCDEVQDFTDIQLSLLIRLPRNPGDILLAGDPKQIINPSGFRWEEAKRLFYDRGLSVPEVHSLTLNFRCAGNIVQLSNHLLRLKQEILGVRSDEKLDSWKFQGKPPIVMEGMEETALIERLKTTSADQTILTRTAMERDRLKYRLGTELVFTIQEAKGLEFKTVLLWKFGSDPGTGDMWGRMQQADVAKLHDAMIRHEINLLYVGITRSQQNLFLYDGRNASVIWAAPGITELVFRTDNPESLLEVWETASTPEQWKIQGDYFFENDHYRAAAECYRNAGQPELMNRALAESFERGKEFAEAGKYWELLGEIRNAAEAFEKAGDFARALGMWERLGEEEHAVVCRANLLEHDRKYSDAAILWENLEVWDRAVQAWKEAGKHDRLAEIYERDGKIPEAAREYEACGNYIRAAELFLQSSEPDRAAQCYESSGEYLRAAQTWGEIGNQEERVRCLEKLNDPQLLGEVYEGKGDWSRAIRFYRKAMSQELEVRFLEELKFRGKGSRSARAVRLAVLGRLAESAQIWKQLRQFELAAALFLEAGEFHEAALCYKQLKNWREAVLMFARSPREPAKKYSGLRSAMRKMVSSGLSSRNQLDSLAARWRAEGLHDRAMHAYEILRKYGEAGDCAVISDDIDQALSLWAKGREFNKIADCFVAQEDWEAGADILKKFWKRTQDHVIAGAMEKLYKASHSNPKLKEMILSAFWDDSRFFTDDIILEVLEESGHYDAIRMRFLSPPAGKRKQFSRKAVELESTENKSAAGLYYLLAGDKEAVGRCWRDLPADFRKLRCFESAGLYRQIVEYWVDQDVPGMGISVAVRNGDEDLAKEIIRKSGEFEAGGDELAGASLFEDALEIYKEGGVTEGIVDMLDTLGRHREAAKLKRGWPKKKRKRSRRSRPGQESLF